MKKKDNNLLSNHLLSFFEKSPKRKYNYRQLLNQLPYQAKKMILKKLYFYSNKEKE